MKVKKYVDHEGRFIGIRFMCPGCKEYHALPVSPTPSGEDKSPHYVVGESAHWHFNGDYESPTLSPSVNAKSGHHAGGRRNEDECWCTFYEKHPPEPGEHVYQCYICHFFLREGKIEFLHDCTHELSGQTVVLPDIIEEVTP